MDLNERKIKILEAIISDYIVYAEPVGSRTIAKKYEMGISSATIRNEMSDLEEMGLIIQPHASSGRIPSVKGYRLYVDSLMHNRELTDEEMKYLNNLVVNNINQIDFLMKETAKALSFMTSYTTIVSEPKLENNKIKHIQLVPIDAQTILLIVVMDSKAIKSQPMNMKQVPDIVILSQISLVLDKNFNKVNVFKINEVFIEKLEIQLGEYAYIAREVCKYIVNILKLEHDVQVYTSGVKNILSFPEFNDIDKAKGIFHTLEEKDLLITLLEGNSGDKVQIIIGTENNIKDMHDCSVISANYNIGGRNYGSIGIIGPTRMDYAQVIAVLNGIVQNINAVILEN